MKTIEVSERLGDRWYDAEVNDRGTSFRMVERPKYHAQIKDRPDVWAAGISIDDAIGNLVRTHPDQFGIEIEFMGKQSR
jgi:hypothetical protein